VNWQVVLTKQAVKDAKKIAAAGLKGNAQKLIETLERNPYEPPYEKLIGNLRGYYSRRINIQHRLVYEINEEKRIVKILRMWTHYH
jgi:toxin YoeB